MILERRVDQGKTAQVSYRRAACLPQFRARMLDQSLGLAGTSKDFKNRFDYDADVLQCKLHGACHTLRPGRVTDKPALWFTSANVQWF